MPAFARPGASRSITISDGILASASRTPDKMAIREGERSLTYAKLAERIVRVANMAPGHFGLAHGERAAVFMPNRLEYLELVCGLSGAGVAACTIGPAASPPEVPIHLRGLFRSGPVRSLRSSKSPHASAVGDIVPHIVVVDQRYEDLLSRARRDSLPVETDWEDISRSRTLRARPAAPRALCCRTAVACCRRSPWRPNTPATVPTTARSRPRRCFTARVS